MPTAARQSTTEPSGTDRDKLLRQAYSAAAKELRENHRDEFNTLQQKHAKELGVEWSPRLNAEERAAAQMEALFTEFPGLRERYAAAQDNEEEPAE